MKRARLNYLLGKRLTQFCKIPATTLKGKIIRYTSGNNKGQVKYRYAKNPEEFDVYYGEFLNKALKNAKTNFKDSDELQSKVDKANAQILNKEKANAEERRKKREDRKSRKKKATKKKIKAQVDKLLKNKLAQINNESQNNINDNPNNNNDINGNQN